MSVFCFFFILCWSLSLNFLKNIMTGSKVKWPGWRSHHQQSIFLWKYPAGVIINYRQCYLLLLFIFWVFELTNLCSVNLHFYFHWYVEETFANQNSGLASPFCKNLQGQRLSYWEAIIATNSCLFYLCLFCIQ